jgi:hypothetical protein
MKDGTFSAFPVSSRQIKVHSFQDKFSRTCVLDLASAKPIPKPTDHRPMAVQKSLANSSSPICGNFTQMMASIGYRHYPGYFSNSMTNQEKVEFPHTSCSLAEKEIFLAYLSLLNVYVQTPRTSSTILMKWM